MTNALVVYESLFGNARTVATAIGEALAEHFPTTVVEVGKAPQELADVDLLVIGGPNHMAAMPRPSSRAEAIAHHAPACDVDFGLREWLTLLKVPAPALAAAFDTRLEHPRVLHAIDHAAASEEKLLRVHGFEVIEPPAHFYVAAEAGPLAEGELDRARAWAGTLAERTARRLALAR